MSLIYTRVVTLDDEEGGMVLVSIGQENFFYNGGNIDVTGSVEVKTDSSTDVYICAPMVLFVNNFVDRS